MNNGLGLFTAVHTSLSVIALLSGALTIRHLFRGSAESMSVYIFLVTAAATSVTGFYFPFHGMTPALGVGIVAVWVLAWTLFAQLLARQSAFWVVNFAVGLVVSEYLLVFVAIAQAFNKVPALHAMAPTLKEAPFGAAQFVVLVIFVLLAIVVARRSKARVRS